MIKILVVEDNDAIRKAVVDELVIDKFSVVEAADGEEGLKKVFLDKPDLIILDISLPKMDGIEVLKKIRDNPTIANIKVIMFTELDPTDKVIEEMAYLKPCFYLNKSNTKFDSLEERIKECFEA